MSVRERDVLKDIESGLRHVAAAGDAFERVRSPLRLVNGWETAHGIVADLDHIQVRARWLADYLRRLWERDA